MEPGFSIYIAFGAWGSVGLRCDGPSIRVNLGFVSFCLCFFDIEKTSESLLKRLDELEAKYEM